MTDFNEQVAGEQILGSRDSQQDAFAAYTLPSSSDTMETALLLLADGMGGHAGGELASTTVMENFSDYYMQATGNIVEKLQESLALTTEKLATVSKDNIALRKMGTTLIAVVVFADSIQWLSVGDSPLWLFRQGVLTRLNEDHSMVPMLEDLVEIGRMTAEEAAEAPNRHVLRSIVNNEPSKMVDVCQTPYGLESGDLLLLASDGLETLSDAQIVEVLNQGHNNPIKDIVDQLLSQVSAAEKKNQDNSTLLIYRHPDRVKQVVPTLKATASQTGPMAPPKIRAQGSSQSLVPKLLIILLLCGVAVLTFFYLGTSKNTVLFRGKTQPPVFASDKEEKIKKYAKDPRLNSVVKEIKIPLKKQEDPPLPVLKPAQLPEKPARFTSKTPIKPVPADSPKDIHND